MGIAATNPVNILALMYNVIGILTKSKYLAPDI